MHKKTIHLSVNGKGVTAEVEPRLQLADFLREHLLLTGTHLGCEHGVCGACTIEIDGAPARSCIAYAVACDGSEVRTIEGFDDDALMAELRAAFSEEHALQCGFCTPGMLVSARDIVSRVPDADEARIRKELAGNLCRCTGYVGIVRAIQSVIAKHGGHSLAPVGERADVREANERPLAPGTGESPQARLRARGRVRVRGPNELSLAPVGETVRGPNESSLAPGTGERARVRGTAADSGKAQTTLHQSFTVEHPRDKVRDFFGRLDEITRCLPGAAVTGTPTPQHVDVTIRVKVGPIVADFEGIAEAVREPSTYSGVIHGSARDTRSSSMTRGEIRYVLIEEKGGAATRVDVDVGYALTGTLAQFSRSSIVQDIARRMTAAFAQNLEARLSEGENRPSADLRDQGRTAEIDAGSLLFAALWERIKNFFRSSGGR